MAKRKASDESLVHLDNEIKFITKKLLENGCKAFEGDSTPLDDQEQYKFFNNLVSLVFN